VYRVVSAARGPADVEKKSSYARAVARQRRQGGGYAVGAVSRLTGLSEHVLRAWERRHRAIQPQRSPGGTRRYSDADIARLRLLAAAVDSGETIGELAALSDEAIARRLASARPAEPDRLSELFALLARMDTPGLEQRLGVHLSALGARGFLEHVGLPFAREVGARWERGELSVAEEHAATAALRAVLAGALRSRPPAGAAALVFATPAGERHELGLLAVACCAQEHGVRVVYLGCDLPVTEIASAARRAKARVVGLGLVCVAGADAARAVRELRRALPERVDLWLGGAAAKGLRNLPSGTERIADLDALDLRLTLLAGQPAPARA
jgi:DNA-binding transcriptional MerR regulator/methylmalonyl-CoA mutase cobalamin-binding subunit